MSIKQLSGDNTLSIGMKVKMNIPVIESGDLDGVEFTASGKNYLLYMQQHPDEVYTITALDPDSDCPYTLSGFMKDNSWAADELIVVPDPKSNFEVIKNMTQEEMSSQLLPMLQAFLQSKDCDEKAFADFLSAAPANATGIQHVMTGFWCETNLKNPKFSLDKIILNPVNNSFRIDLECFLHGICTIFALELHKQFHYPIFCCYDKYKDEQDDDSAVSDPSAQLTHSFCMDSKNKLYIDVRGIVDDKQAFLSEFEDPFTELFIKEVTDFQLFEQQIKDLMTQEEYDTLAKAAQDWISGHKEIYTCEQV